MENKVEYKLAVVIRKDLGMRCGKIAVQVGHGVAIAMDRTNEDTITRWFERGMKKTVLKVSSMEELLDIKMKCDVRNVKCYSIVDYGLTQIEPNSTTGVVIGIDKSETIDGVTGDLKLL